MSDKNWFYAINGKQYGPVPAIHIKGMFDDGQINEDTLFWTEEMPKCLSASEMSEIVTLETYRKVCPPLSTLPVCPCIKNSKRKSPVLAVILGLIFGPFSALYFGWKVLLTTLLVVFGSTLVVSLVMPFPFPRWFGYAIGLFFAIWNHKLCLCYNNILLDTEDEEFSLATFSFLKMESLYVRFLAIFMGLYSGTMLIRDERWLSAIGVVFFLTPFIIWVFDGVGVLIFTFLATVDEWRIVPLKQHNSKQNGVSK